MQGHCHPGAAGFACEPGIQKQYPEKSMAYTVFMDSRPERQVSFGRLVAQLIAKRILRMKFISSGLHAG
jgi:hypothetical protein